MFRYTNVTKILMFLVAYTTLASALWFGKTCDQCGYRGWLGTEMSKCRRCDRKLCQEKCLVPNCLYAKWEEEANLPDSIWVCHPNCKPKLVRHTIKAAPDYS